MSKYRIYQLAKEFSLDSKKIIDILNKNNINVSNNLNLVGEKEREVIASIVNNKDNNKQQTAKKNLIINLLAIKIIKAKMLSL